MHDTYLACLWSFTYCFTLFGEELVKNGLSNDLNHLLVKGNDTASKDVLELFEWANSLKYDFSYWPQDLPSPRSRNTQCSVVNIITSYTAIYLIMHEYAHLVNKHVDSHRKTIGEKLNEEVLMQRYLNKELESEADQFALESTFISSDQNEIELFRRAFSICNAQAFSLFLLKGPSLKQTDHPDLDVRLINQLDQLILSSKKDRICFHLLIVLVNFINWHNIQISTLLFQYDARSTCIYILDYLKENEERN